MKTKYKAFTLVELLVVIAVITLLVGILMPALNTVVKNARATQVKASFNAISIGLETFRNDHDKYPSSDPDLVNGAIDTPTGYNTGAIDNGAHYLVEALCGIDLLGYSTNVPPNSPWRWYQINNMGQTLGYNSSGYPIEIERNGPYVDINFRQIKDIDDGPLDPLLVDMQEKLNIFGTAAADNLNPIFVSTIDKKAPRPILYYKANSRGRFNSSYYRSNNSNAIYFYGDNELFTNPYGMNSGGEYQNPQYIEYDDDDVNYYKSFACFIWNTKTSGSINSPLARPYNVDSYILLSAGIDGEFGTKDDITNFNR
jgi:prepilin-type N-terminal cleavage/methylation domain-containing protein